MRSCVKYAESCGVRAVAMLLVVIGDGLEPAANTLLLHTFLVLQSWNLFPSWRQQVLASFQRSLSGLITDRAFRTVARHVAHQVDSDSLRPPDRCEFSSSMAARARSCIVVHPSLDRLARS